MLFASLGMGKPSPGGDGRIERRMGMRERNALRPHLSIFLLLVVLLTLGLPAIASAGTFDDAVTNVKVRALLLDKLGADALGIHIEVDRGKVALSGKVEKKSTQELAKEVALSVKGVKEVDNRIVVAESGATRTLNKAEAELRDAVLEVRVKGRLLDQVGTNAMKIEVEASDGVVSLRGRVPSANIRATVLSTAKATTGVRKVIDLIKVPNRD